MAAMTVWEQGNAEEVVNTTQQRDQTETNGRQQRTTQKLIQFVARCKSTSSNSLISRSLEKRRNTVQNVLNTGKQHEN